MEILVELELEASTQSIVDRSILDLWSIYSISGL